MTDVLVRAFKTWLQTFLGLWLASGIGVDVGNLSIIKCAAVGALPAALSVVQNGLKAANGARK